MKSLRLRLFLGTLVWIALSLLVAGVGLLRLFEQHMEQQFYNELRLHLDQLTGQLELDEQGQLTLAQLPTDPRFSRPLSGLYWQIQTAQGEQLRSRSLWDQALELPPSHQRLMRLELQLSPAEPLLVLVRELSVAGQRVQLSVAIDKKFLVRPLARFQRELTLALLVLGVGLALAALVQVWMGLSPLKRLHQALQQVRGGQRAQLEGKFPQEVMPLVEDFNAVLKQNAQMVERAQTQAGNLAHALKTPLTVLANAAYAEPDNPLSALVSAQVSSARSQVDYHLKHARAAANAQRSHAHSAVAETVTGLIRVLARLYEARALRFDVASIDSQLLFKGEQQDLQEMLGNLLDNACKWATSRVRVTADVHGGQLRLTVEDDGAGVADEQKMRVVERGVRADEKVQGSGLGLAIVADLAELYGGQLSLQDSDLGGLKAQLLLPRAPVV